MRWLPTEESHAALTILNFSLESVQISLDLKELLDLIGVDSGPVEPFKLILRNYGNDDLARAQRFVDRVNDSTKVSAQSLWLGARIAHKQSDIVGQQLLVARLRSLFPDFGPLSNLNTVSFCSPSILPEASLLLL